MTNKLERGEAHMYIELKDGHITVYHGDDIEAVKNGGRFHTVLYTGKAPEGTWDKVWEAIKSK